MNTTIREVFAKLREAQLDIHRIAGLRVCIVVEVNNPDETMMLADAAFPDVQIEPTSADVLTAFGGGVQIRVR